MRLILPLLGACLHTFTPETGKYFKSFTYELIAGAIFILSVWLFCMGTSIKVNATVTVLSKSGILVDTKLAVA
ncbi:MULTISPECIES: 2-keto-3-deoxygluconate permease [unclassified Gilliamella]|uniref:2-keto-3-deoxygluconate permease n=1 Tax=unclassified Gilliamella TaxID=2685620 RepID=UPI001C1F96C2